MNRLFGGKKDEPTLEDASHKMDDRVKSVDERIAKLDAELFKLKDLIKRTTGPTQQRHKQRAVQLLQQKRTYEKQQDSMMQQQFNIDQIQFTMDTMKDTQTQVKAMKNAKKQLQKDLKKYDIDKIDDLQDDLAELYYDTQEIQEIMGRSYEVPDDVDDMELLNELEALDEGGVGDMDYLNDPGVLPTHTIELGGSSEPATEEPAAAEPSKA